MFEQSNLFSNKILQKKIMLGSSKGNQEKFFKNNKFYKVDYLGYEGLAETICSIVSPLEHTKYETVKINNKNGCVSTNFIGKNEFKTLQDILCVLPEKFNPFLSDTSVEKGIDILCDGFIKFFNGDVKTYLIEKLIFDCIVLNEDTHINNIGFFTDSEKIIPAPLFDYGLSLLSDSLFEDHDLSKIMIKPFNKLYYDNIEELSKFNVKLKMKRLYNYDDAIYDKKIIIKMIEVLNSSMDITKNILWEEV